LLSPAANGFADIHLVIADVHGMGLWSLLMSLGSTGDHKLVPMAFLGDFLDRGWQGPETIVLVAQLLERMGDDFWIVRGNHEVRRSKGFLI
jgi:hypothetical protein